MQSGALAQQTPRLLDRIPLNKSSLSSTLLFVVSLVGTKRAALRKILARLAAVVEEARTALVLPAIHIRIRRLDHPEEFLRQEEAEQPPRTPRP